MNIIELKNVSKYFEDYCALNNINFSVSDGNIFGLLGPNGAGKTTSIRIINQIIAADKGEVLFKGRPIEYSDIYQIGYLPEERGLYKKMTVWEQALYLAQLKGLKRKDALKQLKYWFEKLEITDWWNKKIEELSKGMAQKVQFVTTVIHNPSLLIFDEPFSGFDPINVNLLKNEILELKNKGATIIFSTHNMNSVEELCDSIALINHSKVILSGEVEEIRQRFKKNIFEISFSGALDGFYQAMENSFFEVQEIKSTKNVYQAKIKISSSITNNELLQILLPYVQILSFKEILPGMDEIFIQVVKDPLA
jgi:ABC-2 type transport system ATP-binding protein